MDDLNEIAVFVKVVQAGSFTQAARQLGMPNSTVSSKVSSLETRLGVTLIRRTTRKLNVTPAGRSFFDQCLKGLAAIETAQGEILSGQGEPQGLLRLTAPAELGSSLLPALVSEFTRKYPKVSIEVLLTDRLIDLLAENFDLAIRASILKDSSLIAKKLGAVSFGLFASPKYLKVAGQPQQPKDLMGHQFVQFTPLGTTEWKLSGPKGEGRSEVKLPVPGRVLSNDMAMIKNLSLAGGGIAMLPTFYCLPEIDTGKLVRILPDWRANANPMSFVYPAQKFVLPKLSAFIHLATDRIRRALEDERA